MDGCETTTCPPVAADATQRYDEILAYLLSTTVAGEIMAIQNYSEMVPLMPNTRSRIETVKQAHEECKHIGLLQKVGRTRGIPVADEIIEPPWKAIRAHFHDAAVRGDLTSCLLIQDLMTESIAIVLYRTLAAQSEIDPRTARVAANILKDEEEHLEIGLRRMREIIAVDSAAAHTALLWTHPRVMPELSTLASTTCESLCDVLGFDCASLDISALSTDIDRLRAEGIEQYVTTLDRAGFDAGFVNDLVSEMSEYLAPEDDGRVCCGPVAPHGVDHSSRIRTCRRA